MDFNFHPFSLLPITLTTLSSVTTLQAQGLGCDLSPKGCELVEACKKTPSNIAMVTQYDNRVYSAWADGQCMPYFVNGSIAKVAVSVRPSADVVMQVDCIDKERVIYFDVIPEGLILPDNLAFLNFFRYGLGAMCTKEPLIPPVSLDYFLNESLYA